MPDPHLEQRIDRLDAAMAELARESAATERDWRRHRAEMRRISAEGQARWEAAGERSRRESAERWAQWRQESAERWAKWKEESAQWWARHEAENAAFQQDVRRHAEERQAETAQWWARHEAENAAFRKEMRRESGELSRRLGTMAEDLVAPGVGRILRRVIGAAEDDITLVAVRMRRRNPRLPGEMLEFDVVAECGDYVLINETKGRLAPEHIPAFLERLGRVRAFFAEYADRRILGAIASLYVDESFVRQGERQGLIVLGFGEDLMDVLNTPGFVPRVF